MLEKISHPSDTLTGRDLVSRFFTAVCFVLCGCCRYEHAEEENHVPETTMLEVKENKISHFFGVNQDFVLPESELYRIRTLLQLARANDVENAGFLLISGNPISIQQQEKVKKQILRAMHLCGFGDSRIIDSGICIYRDAKNGVRIDALKYDLKMPNCDTWSEYIGDINTDKPLPRFGASISYNLGEMIANKADIIIPREYKGTRSESLASGQNSATSAAVTAPIQNGPAPSGGTVARR
jgi:type IV pilus biogenesis protein CpaD/CtpE